MTTTKVPDEPIYRVGAQRVRGDGVERQTYIRRKKPAAYRLARQLEAAGRGPVTVDQSRVVWQAVI